MSDDFVPASSIGPIPSTSYSVRIGKVGGAWAIRVYRGREVLTTEIIGDLDPQIIVTVAQSAISLPSYSPYHIVRAVSPLIREAKSGYVPPPPQPQTPSPAPSQQPVTQSTEPRSIGAPTLLSQITGESGNAPSFVPPRFEEEPVSAAPEIVEERIASPERPPVTKSKIPIKLELKPLEPEELAVRIFSTVMSQFGVAIAYVYQNYGEKSAARMWQHFSEIAELSQGKRKTESFENFVKRRVEEDMILGIEHQVAEFYDDRFVSRIGRCKQRDKSADADKSLAKFQQDLPCMLSEYTWVGCCKAMGFRLQMEKNKNGSTLTVEKS